MRLLLIVSLLLNGVLGVRVFLRRPAAAPLVLAALAPDDPTLAANGAVQRENTAPATPEATPASPPAPALSWQGVESADYHQYAANLRASGCPEDVIRDIIRADVQKLYARRANAIRGESKAREFWQKSTNQRPPPQQMEQLTALGKEQQALLKSVLGIVPSRQSVTDAVYLQTDRRIAELGWLPEAKRAAARRAFEEANLREQGFAVVTSERDPFVQEKKMVDARVALLTDVLSPAELEEYRLRSSPTARRLATETKYLDLSYEDFQRILQASDDLGPVGDSLFRYNEQRLKALRALLGDARGEEFERKTDFNYDGARDATTRLNLPADTADRVWQIKRDAIAVARQVQADAALSNAEKEQRYQSMRLGIRATLLELLGQDGFDLTQHRNSIWLDLLGNLEQ